jgi:hypothetical protein
MEEHILKTIKDTEVGWHGMSLRSPSLKVSFCGIPAISICVQGGPGSIKTVRDTERDRERQRETVRDSERRRVHAESCLSLETERQRSLAIERESCVSLETKRHVSLSLARCK